MHGTYSIVLYILYNAPLVIDLFQFINNLRIGAVAGRKRDLLKVLSSEN